SPFGGPLAGFSVMVMARVPRARDHAEWRVIQIGLTVLFRTPKALANLHHPNGRYRMLWAAQRPKPPGWRGAKRGPPRRGRGLRSRLHLPDELSRRPAPMGAQARALYLKSSASRDQRLTLVLL